MASKEIPRRVLFVDDEENVLRSLKRLFVSEDCEVLTALSGAEGLEVLKKNEIPVIVSDQRMPIMSGAEFLQKSQEISPDSIRIILTGYADIDAAINAINHGGAYRYVSKPWNDADLVLVVNDAFDKYRLISENRYLNELTSRQNEELKKWNSELEFYVQKHTIDLSNQNKELTKLNEKLRKNMTDMLASMTSLIELRSKTMHSHSNNVSILSVMLAKKVGLSERDIADISIAAELHDIGKIGNPDIVLTKNISELAPDEMTEYIKHPVLGQAVIDCIEELREPGILVRHHHEWYNGKGFPDSLKAEAIPLGSRIMAIADYFDHLLHTELRSVENALMQIKSLLATQFDHSLFPMLESAAKDFSILTHGEDQSGEIELAVKNLESGLILSRDVRTGTGLLLLRKNTVLNQKNIETLQRGYYLDPAKNGVFVFLKKNRS
jgi:response regulator RpfG family c-di-GMP phosphodiesterase